MDKIEALKSYLESQGDLEDGVEVTADGWCMRLSDGREWLVLTDAERAETLEDDLRSESAQFFNPSFLAEQTDLPQVVFEKLCDGTADVNDAVVALIDQRGGMARFMEAAVAADGWGHFLSGYDGEEIELPGGFYAYRHN